MQRVDEQGRVLQSYRYTAFGNELNNDPNNANPFRFNGMYWDAHTQTYMTPNRHLNPRTGRWLSPDPFFHVRHGNLQSCATQSGNLFMFVMHNPVRWTDPTGLFAIPPDAWNALQNFSRPNPSIPTAEQLVTSTPPPPITITRDRDDPHNITINAFVNIWGSGADAHRQSIVDGIIHHWGGTRGIFNVNVNIFDQGAPGVGSGRPGSLSIEVRNGAGQSHLAVGGLGWSPLNPGAIVLYTQFWEHSGRDFEAKTVEQMMWAAAHEFGHALGIADGPVQYNSMMAWTGYAWFLSAGTLEIEMALRAQRTGTFQLWHNNPLVVRYGILR